MVPSFYITGMTTVLIMTVYALIVYGVMVLRNRYDIADSIRPLSGIIAVLISYVLWDRGFDRGGYATMLVVIWGIHSIVHYVWVRRYTAVTDRLDGISEVSSRSWKWHLWMFGEIVVCSIFIMVLVALPVLLINTYTTDRGITVWDIVGGLIWVIGYGYEVIADWQRITYMKDVTPMYTTITSGLWHYSRHPDYWGEIMQWWGVYGIALAVPFGWIGIIGPLVITGFLVWQAYMLEKKLRHDSSYNTYRQETCSMIIPWFVRHNRDHDTL